MTNTPDKMPDNATDRPLVTFALFAYNQEQYIREAVEGAFAQTYEPLEIILSDDCSTDRTFEIMQEMAADYRGDARIVVRRSPFNRGVVMHIGEVTDLSQGEFMIVAAGDDISLPERTAALAHLMLRESTQFASSNFTTISETGEIISSNISSKIVRSYIWQVIDSPSEPFAVGSVAGYRRDFIKGAINAARNTISSGRIYNEDEIFAAYAVALDTQPSNFSRSALVHYRVSRNSLSGSAGQSKDVKDELLLVKREVFRSSSRLACIQGVLEIASNYPQLRDKLNHNRIKYDMRRSEIELIASDKKFVRRIAALANTQNFNEFKIIAPRLLGQRTLAAMRFFRKKLSRQFIK